MNVQYPCSKIDSLHLHDHYSTPTDDPKLRPSIFDLVEKLIEPNGFVLRSLKLEYYRSSIIKVTEFLGKLDKLSLKSLHLKVQGNFEESD